jgi:hypothetical protein
MQYGKSLRELYRDVELPGQHPLDELHEALDVEVSKVYGMKVNADPLKYLFDLNKALAALESASKPVTGPGLPAAFVDMPAVLSADCIVA